MKYLAYGSNMSLNRLRSRTPSARRLGVFELRRHKLKFHKVGQDGSAKCNAFFTGIDTDIVEGVGFEINPGEILDLEGDMKDMDNPMKLFQSLLSGDKEKGVGKLMTTVCDKLKHKMENGDVNQEDLLTEATTLLQSMGGLGANDSKDGPNLSGMMSMMQNLSAMGDLFNGSSGGGSRRRGRKVRRKMEKKLRKNRKK